MFKVILLCIFFTNPLIVLAEPRISGYSRINFKDFAKLSAILSQCENPTIEKRRKEIDTISQKEGLKLAKQEKYTMYKIGQEVANILYNLDKIYPEQIPLAVCLNTLQDFDMYITSKELKNKQN